MSLTNLKINNIPGREFILSPTVKNGSDIECSSKDFYQYSKKIILKLILMNLSSLLLFKLFKLFFLLIF